MATTRLTKLFTRSLLECLLKNVATLLLVGALYLPIFSSLESIGKDEMSDFLFLVSIMLVTACFANFAFSYEFSIIENAPMRYFSHVSTFIFMGLIALLLEAMVIAVGIVYPALYTIVTLFCVLLYVGIALYDFWDLFRKFNVEKPGFYEVIEDRDTEKRLAALERGAAGEVKRERAPTAHLRPVSAEPESAGEEAEVKDGVFEKPAGAPGAPAS